jgi:hypothetical protein
MLWLGAAGGLAFASLGCFGWAARVGLRSLRSAAVAGGRS